MRLPRLIAISLALFSLSYSPPAAAEPYQEYLERLKEICSVDCMQPKQFQRKARKRPKSDESDMALIMDVAFVTRAGDKYELHNFEVQGSALEELAILGSAGINTGGGNGLGGRSRGTRGGKRPNLIVIEFDKQTFLDLLNTPTPSDGLAVAPTDEDGIIVEGETEREVTEPSLADLRSMFRNRRIVVRGQPRLEAVWVGARLDHRRKQVTLVVDNAEDLALLPRFDDEGNAILGE